MPTPTKGPRLGGSPTHERIILANLATQLFEHGKITTTEAKAKRLRPLAEKLITKARRGDLHNRRQVLRTIRDTDVVHILFAEIGPAMEGREGGYTRITKIAPRKGDNAPMAVIEIITEKVQPKAKSTRSDEKPAAAPGAGTDTTEVDPEASVDDQAVDTLEVGDGETTETAEVDPEASVDDQAVDTLEVDTDAEPKADEKA